MPAILDRLVMQMRARGVADPYKEAVAHLQKCGVLKPGSDSELTALGITRNDMSPAERAIDRASKNSGGKHHKTDYTYNQKTNTATLKQRR